MILALSVSALLATEFSFTAHIVLAAAYILLFATRKMASVFAVFLGVANYFLQIFSGGFIAGILLSFSDDDNIPNLSIIAGIIMLCSCILLNMVHLEGPFKIAWWMDVVLCLLVSVSCKTFLNYAKNESFYD